MGRPRYVIFGMQSHMMTRNNIKYIILTSGIGEGHLRSKQVKQRSFWSIFKNDFSIPIFGIQTFMIPLNIIGYTILTFEVIKGH